LVVNKTHKIFLFLLIAWGFVCGGLNAQTRENLEEQRRQALSEIANINRLLEQNAQSQRVSVESLNLLNAQIRQFNRLIGNLNAEIAYVDRQISLTSSNIGRMTNEIERLKEEYAKLIFQTYKNRGKFNVIIYVLAAKDFNEAYRRFKYFQQYSDFRKKQVAEIQEKQEELGIVIASLATQRVEKEQLLAEQRQESRKLDGVRAELDRETARLRTQEQRFRTDLARQQQNERQLSSSIRRIIEEEARRLNATPSNVFERLTPEDRLISNNFRENRGRMPWPVETGSVSATFGESRHPLFRNVTTNNPGINITTTVGSDVRAVFEGEVQSIGMIPGEGLFVMLKHGNFYSIYYPLTDIRVNTGSKVQHREVLGKITSDAGARTAVLNFQIWDDKPLNPEQWLARNR